MKMSPLPGSFATLSQRVTHKITRPMSRDKADTLLLLAACALVLAPHVMHLPAWVTLSCSALLLWRGWITFRGNRMPPRWILLPIAVLAMGGVYWSYRTLFGRDAGVVMLVLLLALKLLEMHAKRDLFVVVFLSFFLLLTNFFYTQSIGTALMMIISIIAILTTQLSFQYTGAVPPLKQRLRLGALILGLAAPLMLVLFLLFPRVQGPLWGLPGDANAGHSGMSDTMAPGTITQLALSDDIAFRVKFIDQAPPKSKMYWRGVVLGNYDGRTWTQLRRGGGGIRMQNVLTTRGTPIRHQITLEPNGRRWLFALELPTAVPQLFGDRAVFADDMQLVASQAVNDRVRYDVASYVDFDLEANASTASLQDWLELPAGFNPKTLVYAANLRRQSSDDLEIVKTVLKYFREQKFTYTLEPPPLGRDAVDEFLFTTRAGFCEHYASSFVVLMRALDIPARVVTGYQGGEINTVDGFFTVRQSDAHAWVEVWLPKRGWLRVDPTAAVAPDRVELNLNSVIPRGGLAGLVNLAVGKSTWLTSFRFNWDAVTNGWNQWVLNYNPGKQKNFLRALGFDDVDWPTLAALTFAIGAIVIAIIALPLLRNRQVLSPVDALYLSLCQLMARRGVPRMIYEGPHAYAARLTAAESPLAASKKIAAARFLKLYEAARYGTVSELPSRSLVSQLNSLLAECR